MAIVQISIAGRSFRCPPLDFDPKSVRIARDNARKNGVLRKIHLTRRDVTKLPLRSEKKYDFICANLISTLLIAESRRILSRLKPDGIDQDDLELHLMDHGLEEFGEGTGDKGEAQLVARCLFADFGHMQEALEKRGVHPVTATHEYIATTPIELPEAQANEVLQLVDALEQNDDVQNVYHSLV